MTAVQRADVIRTGAHAAPPADGAGRTVWAGLLAAALGLGGATLAHRRAS